MQFRKYLLYQYGSILPREWLCRYTQFSTILLTFVAYYMYYYKIRILKQRYVHKVVTYVDMLKE